MLVHENLQNAINDALSFPSPPTWWKRNIRNINLFQEQLLSQSFLLNFLQVAKLRLLSKQRNQRLAHACHCQHNHTISCVRHGWDPRGPRETKCVSQLQTIAKWCCGMPLKSGPGHLCTGTCSASARKSQSQQHLTRSDHALLVLWPHALKQLYNLLKEFSVWKQTEASFLFFSPLCSWVTKGPCALWGLANVSACPQSGVVPVGSDSRSRTSWLATSSCILPSEFAETCEWPTMTLRKRQRAKHVVNFQQAESHENKHARSPCLVKSSSVTESGSMGLIRKSLAGMTGISLAGNKMRSTNCWKVHSWANKDA